MWFRLATPALALLALLVPLSAQAATCSNPSGSTGEIVFNTTYSVVQVCNTSGNWVALGGNGNDGSSETDPQVGSLTNGKWCTSDGTMVTCNADAPTFTAGLTDLTDTNISTPSEGQVLTYSGGTWINSTMSDPTSDRITSDTTSVTANTNGNTISFTTAGTTTAYINSAGRFIGSGAYFGGGDNFGSAGDYIASVDGDFGILGGSSIQFNAGGVRTWLNPSGFWTNEGSIRTYYIGGDSGAILGVNTYQPSTTLHVSGTLRIANGGESCDADRTGAIRFTAGQFQVCRNGTSWETLVAGASGTAETDRITSGTTAVTANTDGNTVSITTAGTTTSYFHGTLGLVTPGVSATGPISGTRGYFDGELRATGDVYGSRYFGWELWLDNDGFLHWSNDTYIVGNGITHELKFGANNTDAMIITSNSYVGIGTLTPTAELEVNGTISATNITLNGQPLASALSSDRITSGTTSVIASAEGGVVFETGLLLAGSYNDSNEPDSLYMGLRTGDNPTSNTLAIGHYAARNNTRSNITAIGNTAAYGNTGMNVTAIGIAAGFTNSGDYLTAIGTSAAEENTGTNVTAVGLGAAFTNTGDAVIAIGENTASNNKGDNVVAIGNWAASSNEQNGTVAVGYNALVLNTTGLANTAVGFNSLMANVGGSYNTALGFAAGQGVNNNNSFSANTFLGAYTGSGITTGSSNTIVGANSGMTLTTGERNILLGAGLTTPAATTTDYLSIGNAIFGDIASGLGYANRIGINVAAPTTALEVSGTISATALLINGQPVTGGGSADRITSGTTAVTANTGGDTVSITTAGTTTSYFHGTLGLVTPGVSATGTVSGVQVYTPLLRLAGVSSSGGISLTNSGDNLGTHTATQNLNMGGFNITNVGTISGTFVGDGSGLTNLSVSGDRIISGTSNIVVNTSTSTVSFTLGGVTVGYLHPTLGLVGPGVSTTGTISGTTVATPVLQLIGVTGSAGVSMTSGGSADNLGDHTATQALDMGGFNITGVGNVSASGSIQPGNADTSCSSAADYGKMRFNPATSKMFMCRP